MVFKKIKYEIFSRRDVFPLALILASSPLPPLSTLHLLKEWGFYKYLDLKNRSKYCGEMRRLLEKASADQVSGGREFVEGFLKSFLGELGVRLVSYSERVKSFLEAATMLVLTVPVMVASLLVFIDVLTARICFTFLPFVALLVATLVYSGYPLELATPLQPRLAVLSLSPLVLLLPVPEEAKMVVLALSAIPLLVEKKRFERRLGRVVDEITRAREDVSYVPKAPSGCGGFLKGVYLSLKIMKVFSADIEPTAFEKLRDYVGEYLKFYKKINSEGLNVLLFSLTSMLVLSASLAVLASALSFTAPPTASMQAPVFFNVPERAAVEALFKEYLLVASLVFSITISLLKEGNPLYYPLYLFPLLLAALAGYQAGLLLASKFFG